MSLKTTNGYLINPIATQAAAITTSDATVYAEPYVGVYIGGAGNLKVDLFDPSGVLSTGITFTGLAAGQLIPICVSRIYATGTTATLTHRTQININTYGNHYSFRPAW
jgi:hypothetical protein